MLFRSGLPQDAIIWLLMLPLAITAIVVIKQVIGLKGLSISTSLLIGFAFVATGLQAGIIIYAAALGVGFLMRLILGQIRLLYLPKLALLLLGVTIAIAFIAPFLPYQETSQLPRIIFPIIIIVLLVERFTSLLIERGFRKTSTVILETLVLSVVIFFIVSWGWLQEITLSKPIYIMAAAAAVNLFLGKWTGLRFSEYIRFRNLILK